MRVEKLRRPMGSRASLILICAGLLVLAVAFIAASCGGGSTTTTAAPGTTGGAGTTASSTTGSSSAAAGGAQVSIKGFAFNPASVTIKVGESVTWTNDDGTTHTVTADNAGFKDSGDLAQGATYTATFDKAGTFTYHCSIHPTMKGTIVVQ